ncbi:MAG TPA: Ig-like domain-containing protein [Candidatus Dormibacteraeota bacterium]
MNSYHDPELEDVLQDAELRRVASLLRAAKAPEPPLDDAFRTGLRRQLMQEAWSRSESRGSWWRRAFAPPGIAWAGAAAGLLLIASVVVWLSTQQSGGLNQVYVASPIDGKSNVSLGQPILVSFNQPMDHQTTQDAVQIAPATTVTFSWDQSSRTLAVQPSSGNLAPNTQYQVTVGPGAKTATNQPLSAPQTITFVTQAPSPTPAPPTPHPTPANPLGEKQLAPLNGAAGLAAQWSADSSTIYFVDGKGALGVVPAKGGSVSVIALDGTSSPSISPAGDRLAYLRGGKIEVLTFATGKNEELAPAPAPTLVGWAKDKLVWAAADGIYTRGDTNAPNQLAPLPTKGSVAVLSISPDGTHVAYQVDKNLFVLDLGGGTSVKLGQTGDSFTGWSPDGTLLLYSTADHVVVADGQGVTQSTLPLGDANWSTQDAILLGSDTDLTEIRPDGSHGTKLSSGTYHLPLWAPDGSSFAYVRGSSLWVAVAPALPPEPTVVDEATTVVKQFMDARLNNKPDQATALLDDTGKKAYAADGGLNLTITGDPHFSRYYILTQEATGTAPDTVRFVVRLVLTHAKLDVSDYEETVTLVRDASSKQFLIDQAAAGGRRDLGKGAEVVSIDVAADTIKVTFDSDLDPATVNSGVLLLDSRGNQVEATVAYASRAVTLSGLNLAAGKQYKLVVLTTVRDVLGHNVAAEYDLNVLGPSPKKHANHKVVTTPAPAATPSASASSSS